MSTYYSEEVRTGLEAARLAALKKVSRLRVLADEGFHPVLRMWRDGFSVEAATVPPLRGLVDLYDGSRHLYQCLVVATGLEGGEMRYEFKRSTIADDHVPLDFYREPEAPVGLLGRGQ